MSDTTQAGLSREVETFLDTLVPQKSAVVVGLYGELGAGKTAFTQALANALGVIERVTSPTFVLEKVYALKNQKFSHLIHIDAYRLERSNELKQLGWDTIVLDRNNLIVIEWADRIEDILPKDTKRVYFTVSGERTRTISYS